MMVPRVRPWRRWFSAPYGSKETSAGSQPHRQLCFYRAQALLRRPRYRVTQGSSTSPTTTLACTQGSGTSLPDTVAHSYTPHCTPGPSPYIYKREVQGLPASGSRGGTSKRTGSLSLSLSRTLVTPTTSTPWCEITRATFPFCVPSCANPSGQGHAAIKFTGRPGWGSPGVRNADTNKIWPTY
jgi:hypothetical protein